MQRVRARLLQDREEEVKGTARLIYSERQARGQQQGQIDGFADWVEAENRVIRSTFERQTGCTLSLTASTQVSHLAGPRRQLSTGRSLLAWGQGTDYASEKYHACCPCQGASMLQQMLL